MSKKKYVVQAKSLDLESSGLKCSVRPMNTLGLISLIRSLTPAFNGVKETDNIADIVSRLLSSEDAETFTSAIFSRVVFKDYDHGEVDPLELPPGDFLQVVNVVLESVVDSNFVKNLQGVFATLQRAMGTLSAAEKN
jgi:hypothetical protein